MKTSILYLGFWLISTCIWGSTLGQSEEITLIEDYYYLADSTRTLNVYEVDRLLLGGGFSRAERKPVHFTIMQPVVWLSFELRKTNNTPLYLSPGNESNIWKASLYVKDSLGKYSKTFEYDHLKKDADDNSLYFSTLAIHLPSDGTPFLLKLEAQQNRNYSMVIGNRYAISKYLILRERIPIAYIGFMLCIFIYNSFLFLSTRIKALLPYLIYLLMVTFAVPFHSGFVLFSTAGMWQGEPWYTVWLIPLYASGGFFSILYLNLKENAPKLRNMILLMMAVVTIIIPITDSSQWIEIGTMSKIAPVFMVLYNLSLWVAGLYVWINGVKHARFYVLGWVFVILSLTVFSLSMFDIIPYSLHIDFVLYFGFGAESVLFAFALGDQMNILRKEKESMKSVHLVSTTEKNRLLAQQLFMNSHVLRAPLSRILGLLGLLNNQEQLPENKELIGYVGDATLEMDGIARKMSAMLEKEGYLDQYQKDFEKVKQSIYEEPAMSQEDSKSSIG